MTPVTLSVSAILSLAIALAIRFRDKWKARHKHTVLYLLVAGCLSWWMALGVIAWQGKWQYPALYLGLQGAFLLAGIGHVFAMPAFLPWSRQKVFWREALFTAGLGLLACIILFVAFRQLSPAPLPGILLTATIALLIPFTIRESCHRWLSIPEPVFKAWAFPEDAERPDLVWKHTINLTIQVAKKADGTQLTDVIIEAPLDVSFGQFFLFFLHHYNLERNRENPIQLQTFSGQENQPYFSWHFYLRGRWWRSSRHIDPERTVRENQLTHHSRIVAKRVPPVPQHTYVYDEPKTA